jgi:K+-transporting ATPase ATPase B chain
VSTGPSAPPKVLRRNLAIYGLGGLIVPFIGIKADRPGVANCSPA